MILGAALILMMSCREHNTTVGLKNSDEKTPVNVVKSETRQYIPSIELSGTAYADKEANLGAAIPGRVEKVYFPEGSKVRKGDLLVSLSGELYTQALVEFNTIEKDFERVSRLNEKGSISQQDFDHVKAMYDASRSKVEMMKKNAEITAPFSGTIVEYLVNEGENYLFNINLEPGYSKTSGILRLMKLDPIQVKIEVNEKDLEKLKKGQEVIVTFDAFPSSTFNGKLADIEQVLSILTHTATVKVELGNSSGKIKPGMFAHVKIELSPFNAVCVPLNAIYRQPGTSDDFLFIAGSNKVKKQKIVRLWADDIWVGVDGISSGETIVTSGKEKLHDESLIEIK
jgi:membrane fusion protein (multidrug efflux system)